MLKTDDELKIAIAFSGGGYRAAAFNLGVISFLNEVRIGDKTLLENVCVLSTVSGGTITGTKYAIGLKKGESFKDIYASLYSFMVQVDLVSLSMTRLVSSEGWNDKRIKSLINAIADVYDEYLFFGEKFETILKEENDIHLKHISFNSTEFANALQFRFQLSEEILKPAEGEPKRGIIGNFYYSIPPDVAGHIRIADILAASSCFPGGFEPINFPTDFVLPPNDMDSLAQQHYPVGLMDGGIVDNQGIEPILLAEARMKRNSDTAGANQIDLIIVSDVASPYMEDYKASIQRKLNWWRKLTPKNIVIANSFLLLTSLVLLLMFVSSGSWWTVLFSSMLTISVVIFFLGRLLISLPSRFQVPKQFLQSLSKLLKIKLLVYENLVVNRVNSLLKMSNDVFLKHVRRLNYQRLYTDDTWENRRIMNAIYELRNGENRVEEKIKNGRISESLRPGTRLKEVATRASIMATTLWFNGEEKERREMVDTIIACGQFTMCWNFLEYIEKLKRNSANTNLKHSKLLAQEPILRHLWQQFQDDPYWLIKQHT